MKIEFTLTFDIFKAAYALYQRRQLSVRLMFPISIVILAAGILGAVVVDDKGPYWWLGSLSAGAIGGGFVGTILLPLFRIYAVRRSFRNFLPKPVSGRILSFEIDDDQIRTLVPGVGLSEIQWSAIYGFAQNEKVTLLYLTKNRFYFFPTTALTPEQRTELNAVVGRHGVKKKPC